MAALIRETLEGVVTPEAVLRVCHKLLELGVDEIDLGDTIGAATPETIEPVIMEVIDRRNTAADTAGRVGEMLIDRYRVVTA